MMFGSPSITLILKIHYKVKDGGQMIASGESDAFGKNVVNRAVRMRSRDGENWDAKVNINVGETLLVYRYGYITDNKSRFEAIQSLRSVSLEGLKKGDTVIMRDTWRSPKSNVFVSTAFREAIFAGSPEGNNTPVRQDSALGDKSAATRWKEPQKDSVAVRFTVVVPRLTSGHSIRLTGEHEKLGKWDKESTLGLVNLGRNVFSLMLEFPADELPFEYKYCIFDKEGEFVFRERGTPRELEAPADNVKFLSVDENFKYENVWKGAGVAVPVFSLRSSRSMGIGEFLDLKILVDWAAKVKLSLIQVLPVNDTGDNPSPYSATSVFALHPVYLNVQEVAAYTFGGENRVPHEIRQEIEDGMSSFNGVEEIEYTGVLAKKDKILTMIFSAGGDNILADAGCKAWQERNSSWLPGYACWKSIMAKTGEWVFTQWEHSAKDVPRLTSKESEFYDSVRYHVFVQYNLHLQLLNASNYAKAHGVALKGDLPIGVARYCADTWIDTDMFRMNWSAGAPTHGPPPAQNWDFPLYNWDLMKKDGFQWWRRRLAAMEEYFQAFRIDHVLGFFRIWAIPAHNYSGLLGRYDPCPKPITRKELASIGIKGKLDRYTNPYIHESDVAKKFGESAKFVQENFLDGLKEDKELYNLRDEVSTHERIHTLIHDPKYDDILSEDQRVTIRTELCNFVDDRLLIQDEQDPDKFYLVCHMFHTASYKALKEGELKTNLDRLWHNFFWERQKWGEDGYEKLAAMQDAANMMVCGEDLGAVPSEAYEVLDALGILGLRIQRWPIKGEWGEPAKYSYLSVAAPSCHDCSTLRQWWTEDRGARQHFYRSNFEGEAPWECYDWVSQKIVEQHLNSTSMWTIVPIQDFLDMWDELRSPDPLKDMINRPGTMDGNWVYRMRLPLEALCEKSSFNKFLGDMVVRTKRVDSY